MSLVDALILPPLPNLPDQSVSSNSHQHKKALFLTLNGLDQNVLMKLNSTSDTQVDTLALKRQEQQQEGYSLAQELQQQQHHHHHHHHHYYHHHYKHQLRIPSPPNHSDSTSFILGANQETESVATYSYTPITTPSSSPLTTSMDEEKNIVSDDITTTTSTIDSNNFTDSIKKKSIRSRLKDALKKSNLSSKGNAAKSPATPFSFLPSSSSPIPNTKNQLQHPLYPNATDISKRHSASSTLLTTRKPQLLQEKHNSKARSWHPPPADFTCVPIDDLEIKCTVKANKDISSSTPPHQYHQQIHHTEPPAPLPPSSKATISPLFLTSTVVEKDTDCSPTSSTSSLDTPPPLTPVNAISNQISSPPCDTNVTAKRDDGIITTTTTTTTTTTGSNDMKVPFSPLSSPTPLVQPVMPQSRFLTAFHKLRQQKPALDQTVNHVGTTSSSTRTHSPLTPPRTFTEAASPVMPSPSSIAAGSKSTSFAEKIKTRFQSNLSNRPGQRLPPPPPSSSRLPIMKSVTTTPMTTKKPKTATATTKASTAKGTKKTSASSVYRPELASQAASTSPMNQSWSHFSRSFAPSCSVQHASARYSPQKMKLGSKKNEKVKLAPQQKQSNLTKGQKLPPSYHTDYKKSTQRTGYQFMPSPGSNQPKNSTATISSSVPCQQNESKGSIHVCGHPFDADTQVTLGNMIISPTCSTSSHHSSITTLSATESISSISTSTSPISPRSSSTSPDSKTNMVGNDNDNSIISITDKSSSELSESLTVSCSSASHLSFASDQSANKMELSVSSSCSSSSITAPESPSSSETENKACIAPIALSSPTPTATTTTTSTNPSSILTMKNKASKLSNAPQLTLKSPKRNIGKQNGAWNKGKNKHISKSALTSTPTPAPTKTKTVKHRNAIIGGDPFSNININISKSTFPNNKNKKKKLRVRFISTAKVQDTFSKYDYDRASDPYAVCTRLTADMAQQIKDELNAFKLEEMMVHRQSRGNTQFFM